VGSSTRARQSAPPGESPPGDRIQSLSRGLRILEFVHAAERPVGIKEVAFGVGLQLPTAYHLVNTLLYDGRGVAVVIAPWNFPLAILCGMTVAAVVCGNTVVLKPSSDSPTIAAKFFEAMEEAGLPPGVVNFCPGAGGTFGRGLVAHPKTRFVAFTGSRDAGLDIHASAAQKSWSM